jgi:DNA-binding CsgD family transcriptional regulator
MLTIRKKKDKRPAKKPVSFNTLEALRLADDGKPISEIAEKLNAPYHVVYRFFRSKEILVREGKKGGSSTPKCDHDVILILARRGQTLSEIARNVGVSREAVRLILQKNGMPTDIRKIRAQDRAKRVESLLQQGKSCQEIASDTELSYNAIRTIIKSLGLEVPGSSTLTFDGTRAIKMAQDGHSVSEIAKALDTRYYNVLNFLRRRGIEIVEGHRGRLTFDPNRVKDLAGKGLPLKRLAEHAKAKPHNVRMFLDRHSIPYVRDWIPTRVFQEEAAQAKNLLGEGKNKSEIAKALRYTEECIERLLKAK